MGSLEPFPFAAFFAKEWKEYGCFLLTGEVGAGKSTFGLQFIHDVLQAGGQGIIIHTTVSPEDLLHQARSIGFDLTKAKSENRLIFVDCYSTYAGAPSTAQFSLKPGDSLTHLSFAIRQAKEEGQGFRFLFDDLSSLLAYVNPDSAYKFVQTQSSRLKEEKAIALFILVPGVLEPSLEKLLYSIFDGHLQIKVEDSPEGIKRYFRVYHMRGAMHRTDWSEMRISDSGISLKQKLAHE